MVIAIVGSGGKTTLLKQMAHTYRSQGKKVFITTTTHMYIEEDTILSDDATIIIDKLRTEGYAMAGVPEGEKIKSLSYETYKKVGSYADVVLVEADGSKHMPFKYPSAIEPVIPDNTDQIIIVTGLHGLNKPAFSVCHRLQLVKECLGIEDHTPITSEHVLKLLKEGYIKPLSKQYPHITLTVHPVHDGTKCQMDISDFIINQLNE